MNISYLEQKIKATLKKDYNCKVDMKCIVFDSTLKIITVLQKY